jgi:hypothetical protein
MTDCNECGNMGYTLKTNDEGEEYMDGCHECFVAAHEADQSEDFGSLVDTVMDLNLLIEGANGPRPLGLVDIAKMPVEWLRRLAA